MREDHARAHDHGARTTYERRDPVRGRAARPEHEVAPRVPPPRADGLPGPDGGPQPTPDDLRVDRRGAPHPRSYEAGRHDRGAARRSCPGPLRPAPTGALLPLLPARALGWPAAARGDRRLPRPGARGDHRRRARVEPRRLGPGRDPEAPARTARRLRHRDARRHPRPRPRVDDRRPRRGDVPRADRGDRAGRGRAHEAAPSVHAGAPRGGAGGGRALAALPVRRAARPDAHPRRLPIPSSVSRGRVRRGGDRRRRGTLYGGGSRSVGAPAGAPGRLPPRRRPCRDRGSEPVTRG